MARLKNGIFIGLCLFAGLGFTPRARADIYSGEAADQQFIRVTHPARDYVRFELCEIEDAQKCAHPQLGGRDFEVTELRDFRRDKWVHAGAGAGGIIFLAAVETELAPLLMARGAALGAQAMARYPQVVTVLTRLRGALPASKGSLAAVLDKMKTGFLAALAKAGIAPGQLVQPGIMAYRLFANFEAITIASPYLKLANDFDPVVQSAYAREMATIENSAANSPASAHLSARENSRIQDYAKHLDEILKQVHVLKPGPNGPSYDWPEMTLAEFLGLTGKHKLSAQSQKPAETAGVGATTVIITTGLVDSTLSP